MNCVKKIAFLLMMVVALPGYSNASACPGELVGKKLAEYEPRKFFYSLAETYIKRVKRWKDSDYCVEFSRLEGNVIVIYVSHRDDDSSISPGGGKSLEVHIDGNNMKILKEMHFQ